jgi:hypothetical protein
VVSFIRKSSEEDDRLEEVKGRTDQTIEVDSLKELNKRVRLGGSVLILLLHVTTFGGPLNYVNLN